MLQWTQAEPTLTGTSYTASACNFENIPVWLSRAPGNTLYRMDDSLVPRNMMRPGLRRGPGLLYPDHFQSGTPPLYDAQDPY